MDETERTWGPRYILQPHTVVELPISEWLIDARNRTTEEQWIVFGPDGLESIWDSLDEAKESLGFPLP